MTKLYPGLTKEQILNRERALERFAAWRLERPHELTPAEALARIGELYELLPHEARRREPDPSGVQTMHRLLAVLGNQLR